MNYFQENTLLALLPSRIVKRICSKILILLIYNCIELDFKTHIS